MEVLQQNGGNEGKGKRKFKIMQVCFKILPHIYFVTFFEELKFDDFIYKLYFILSSRYFKMYNV